MEKATTFFNGMKSGVTTILNASGAALVSMYDNGELFICNAARLARSLRKNTDSPKDKP
ncbi:MAG TPA: hypothetical protein HPP76_08805 [Desulfuromonadales bacterium]|nr:hypothetical protein [Desulfuromonadales bacterium]